MTESYIAQCIHIFRFNPSPTQEQMRDVLKDIGCSMRTIYRALEIVNDSVKDEKVSDKVAEKSRKSTGKKKPKKKKKKRGIKSSIPKKVKPPKSFLKPAKATNALKPIPSDMTFKRFCKYHSYPHYDGLYRWQHEWFKFVWPLETSLTKVSRDHGKSIGHGDVSEWAMSAKGYDILYLGWTDRRKEIADFVYTFFLQRKELIIDKVSSNYHFKTTYGTSFDTYSVKSKAILGMHEMGSQGRQIVEGENEYLEDFVRTSNNPLLMIIDDAIEGGFKKERHKGKDLEDFYLSTIISINPTKLMVVGTKKYQGDFYDFIEEVHKEDIGVFMRTPFLAKDNPRYGKEKDNPQNILCPERWIHEGDPKYPKYLDLKKQKRKGALTSSFTTEEQALMSKLDLMKKKRAICSKDPYWWFAEYMQDPHPVLGEVWPKVHEALTFKGTAAYDMVCIAIDRATTVNKTSDNTGIVVSFREKEVLYRLDEDDNEIPYHNYLVMNDFTQKIDIFDLIPFINTLYHKYMRVYQRTLKIVIVVEKQGGGDDFIALSTKGGYRYAHCIIPVHSTRDKETRIKDTLRSPINNAQISFISSLKDSELVLEITTFPHQLLIDALDALCLGFIECEQLPSVNWNAEENAPLLNQYSKETHDSKMSLTSILRQNTGRGVF